MLTLPKCILGWLVLFFHFLSKFFLQENLYQSCVDNPHTKHFLSFLSSRPAYFFQSTWMMHATPIWLLQESRHPVILDFLFLPIYPLLLACLSFCIVSQFSLSSISYLFKQLLNRINSVISFLLLLLTKKNKQTKRQHFTNLIGLHFLPTLGMLGNTGNIHLTTQNDFYCKFMVTSSYWLLLFLNRSSLCK